MTNSIVCLGMVPDVLPVYVQLERVEQPVLEDDKHVGRGREEAHGAIQGHSVHSCGGWWGGVVRRGHGS